MTLLLKSANERIVATEASWYIVFAILCRLITCSYLLKVETAYTEMQHFPRLIFEWTSDIGPLSFTQCENLRYTIHTNMKSLRCQFNNQNSQ